MALLNVTVLFHKLMLDFFEFGAVDLFELPTLNANEMVMVLVFVIMLVAQHTIAKINLPAQARLGHELDGPGHCSIAYPLTPLSDKVVQFLHGDMPFSSQKRINNLVSLLRMPESSAGHEFCKLLFGVHDPAFLSGSFTITAD